MTPRLTLVSIALFLGLAPVADRAKADSHRSLTIGITQFPATMNPMIESMLAKSYILAMVFRPFVTYDQRWKLVCMLCVRLPSVKNGQAEVVDLPGGKKGMRITWQIKEGVRWGDGAPVTVKDVQFAWKIGRHPKSGVANREPYVRTVAIERVDDRTFVQVIDKVRFDYQLLVPDPIPAHMEEKAFREPAEYKHRTLYDRDFAHPGLYNGPYRVANIVSGSHVELVRNQNWWGREPYFNRIIVRAIGNSAALEANLQAGGIDYAAGELGLTPRQALGLKARTRNKYTFIFKAGLIYEHADFNLDNPILKDRRVRRAMAYGLDRKQMSQALFRGLQPVADTAVSPLDPYAEKDVRRYPYDPRKAAALLDAAGWTLGDDGWRRDAKGRRLTLSLMTTADNRTRSLVSEIMQAYWRRIGIDVRLKLQPPRIFFGRTVSRRIYPGLAMYAWISAPGSTPRSSLHSSMVPNPANGWGGQNYPGFRNKEVDGLIESIETELIPAKRRVLWKRLQQIYADELPVLPLYFRANAYVIPRWLKGIRPTGHLAPSTLWIEEWHAVDEQAKAK
ncbi:MAG: peptide ABC transporter substrate-binding protein [Bauldia litoralis]